MRGGRFQMLSCVRRTIIPVEPEVVIDAIDPYQVEKDERTKNLTILNSRKIDLDVNATTIFQIGNLFFD
jgi:hypothetical protein